MPILKERDQKAVAKEFEKLKDHGIRFFGVPSGYEFSTLWLCSTQSNTKKIWTRIPFR
ncbi:hypothetical protein U27_03435 [Candidatus Vecturithrix granuli]|uniref:Uncharacterized protein n=1 Tax=Vecturithrix granuli TaxID=1499967 RepID=A0A081BVW8_VECG1|nr:hypothetical protein U27_03435 [Candidatus Vecturithrix granuli]